jgi:hypothetical protein
MSRRNVCMPGMQHGQKTVPYRPSRQSILSSGSRHEKNFLPSPEVSQPPSDAPPRRTGSSEPGLPNPQISRWLACIKRESPCVQKSIRCVQGSTLSGTPSAEHMHLHCRIRKARDVNKRSSLQVKNGRSTTRGPNSRGNGQLSESNLKGIKSPHR